MASVNLFKIQLDILNFYFAHRMKKLGVKRDTIRIFGIFSWEGGVPESHPSAAPPPEMPRTVPNGYLRLVS